MLQAIFETRKAINYFAIGVLVKAILQLPLIIFLGALGPVISTAIGLGVPIALMYNHLHTVTHFSRKTVFEKSLAHLHPYSAHGYSSCGLLLVVPVCTVTNKPYG